MLSSIQSRGHRVLTPRDAELNVSYDHLKASWAILIRFVASASPSSLRKERKRQRVFFHHPSVYPILVRIRNIVWVYAIMTIVVIVYITPATSMETHMSILEDSNIVFRNIWWTMISGPIQREYWRRDRRKGLDEWIDTEREVAWDRMLRNIGPISGAADGLVIASPSAGGRVDEPDYYVSPLPPSDKGETVI